MTNNEKAVATLTRMGPFSARQAEAYVEALTTAEVAELVSMHDELETATTFVHQGGWFADFQANVSDRLARDAAEKAAPELTGKEMAVGKEATTFLSAIVGMNSGTQLRSPGVEPARYDRKFAEAAAGQAQSDGQPPLAVSQETPPQV